MFRDQQGSLLVTEPLVGYRSFVVRRADGLLFSLSYTAHWPVEGIQAFCTYHVQAPEKHCSCGIYCSKTLEWLAKERSLWPHPPISNQPYERTLLVGAVHLWGKVQQYSEGYRAEWARPVVIYYTPQVYEVAQKAALRYGALMEVLPDLAPPDAPEDPTLLAAWKARAREASRERYKKKAAEQKALIAQMKAKGYMTPDGKWTDKANAIFNKTQGGGDA